MFYSHFSCRLNHHQIHFVKIGFFINFFLKQSSFHSNFVSLLLQIRAKKGKCVFVVFFPSLYLIASGGWRSQDKKKKMNCRKFSLSIFFRAPRHNLWRKKSAAARRERKIKWNSIMIFIWVVLPNLNIHIHWVKFEFCKFLKVFFFFFENFHFNSDFHELVRRVRIHSGALESFSSPHL